MVKYTIPWQRMETAVAQEGKRESVATGKVFHIAIGMAFSSCRM
jgi:hypothetical protein